MIERADEVERKYEAELAATLPDVAGVAGVVCVGEALVHELEAVYFDTAALDLARRGVTLRRRTGGGDDGWHLKLPGDGDSRTEVRAPLGRAVRTVPRSLREVVRAAARDRALAPVAVIRTHRREVSLLDERGVVLAHVCDDDVRAERLVEPAATVRWREWEVELAGTGTWSAGAGTGPSGGTDGGADGTALLEEVEARLIRAGAHRASVTSKLARTLDGVAMPERPGQGGASPAGARVADVLADHLAQQLDRLILEDARLRLGEADAVHHLRIAARRIRSALTTYAPVAPDGVDDLRAELRWLGQALSGARDAQVLRSHLAEVLAGEPEDLVLGPVRERIDAELDATAREGAEHTAQALDSDRYRRLLDALEELISALPGAGDGRRATTVVPRLLRRDARRLRRAVRAVARAEDQPEHDLALHEARKKAKRLRYAAESGVPVFGDRAEALASAVKEVQDALGRHHDTVVAREALGRISEQAHLAGESTFTFGRLHALEQGRAAQAERDFEEAWPAVRVTGLRRWIAG